MMSDDKVVSFPNFDHLSDDFERAAAPLKSGGGGGTFDGMEARVGQLERSVDRIQTDVTDIRVSLARIEAKLDSKVDYKWLTIYVLGIVAVVLRNEIMAFFTNS